MGPGGEGGGGMYRLFMPLPSGGYRDDLSSPEMDPAPFRSERREWRRFDCW